MTDHRRVLVIEDDDNIATALHYVVEHEGLLCDRIATGGNALGRIRQTRPHLVLLDIMLPELSGYEICRHVRLDPELKAVKILMMTARGSSSEQRKALAIGADGFISKPFALQGLRDQVRRLLGP